VILWVLKPAGKPASDSSANEDLIKVAAAVRSAFGYVPKSGSMDPVDQRMILDQMAQPKVPDGPGQGGRTKIHPDGATGTDEEVQSIRLGTQVIVGGRLIFDRGESTLTPAAISELDQIAVQIRGHLTIVLVKGHTALDDFDDNATPQQKLDLSIKRAQAVSDYLTNVGVDPKILRVVGCSTFEPVVQRQYTANAQSLNRRVEVESTPTPLEELQSPPPLIPATQP
jgi:outer membrane protein OmpA-like peptidoglycan-associated protein